VALGKDSRFILQRSIVEMKYETGCYLAAVNDLSEIAHRNRISFKSAQQEKAVG
jgi:hypothetical protein